MAEGEPKTGRNHITILFIPPAGGGVVSWRLSRRTVQLAASSLAALLVLLAGTLISYRQTMQATAQDKQEIAYLRQVNSTQVKRLDELKQEADALAQDMQRLDALDREIRRMLQENPEAVPTSRGGIDRFNIRGQGGPTTRVTVDEVANNLTQLQQDAQQRERSLQALRDILAQRQAQARITPSIWPVQGEVTSGFGWRASPWGYGGDWHPGIDIAVEYGTPVVATADGEVAFSGWYSGYGKMVQIDHGDGIVTLYGHNSTLLVEVGQYVHKGQVIAYAGSTGASTGPHVHYEVRLNGTPVNPANYLQGW